MAEGPKHGAVMFLYMQLRWRKVLASSLRELECTDPLIRFVLGEDIAGVATVVTPSVPACTADNDSQ